MSRERHHRVGRFATALVLASILAATLPGAHAATGDHERWAMKHVTNLSRLDHSLTRVGLNADLSELARKHSLAMARAGTLFHESDPASVYLKGKTWQYWGENVGMTGGTVSGLEQAFMASTPHRKNILNRSFRHVAIGAVRVDGVLWVTVFFWG